MPLRTLVSRDCAFKMKLRLFYAAPKLLKEALSKEDADDIKKKLEEAGATVVIK